MSTLLRIGARLIGFHGMNATLSAVLLLVIGCSRDSSSPSSGSATASDPANGEPARSDPTPQPTGATPPGMVWIPGGEFTMGDNSAHAHMVEKPAHRVRVDEFWMDQTEVTNAQFREFVLATGYVSTAESIPKLEDIMSQVPPGTPPPPPETLVAGSMVFSPPARSVPLHRFDLWWHWTPAADWRHPNGPGSSIDGMDDHPVVHVSWDDAVAYTKWAGKELPTEAQWEFAARGGLDEKRFVWGNEPLSETKPRLNIWQGSFPVANAETDGYSRTAPVKSFAPNGFGLYEMAGNVWEWCSDWYRPDTYHLRAGQNLVVNPTGPESSFDPREPYAPKRVLRGGSFLCNDSYCSAYRPSARRGNSIDTGMSHMGFRCVMTQSAWNARTKNR